MTSGGGRPASIAPRSAPARAARIIASPPSACTSNIFTPLARDVGRGALDRVRDVVQLGVGEHGAVRPDALQDIRARRPEELEADLQHPDVRRQRGRQRVRAFDIRHIERHDERVVGPRDHADRRIPRTRPARADAPAQIRWRGEPLLLQVVGHAARDLDGGRRIDQGRGPHLHRPCAREQELNRIDPVANATDGEDGHVGHRARDLEHRARRHRLQRGTGEPAGHRPQRRAERRGLDAHRGRRIHQRQAVRPRANDRAGESRRRRAWTPATSRRRGPSTSAQPLRRSPPLDRRGRRGRAARARRRAPRAGPRWPRSRGGPAARSSAGRTPRAEPPAMDTMTAAPERTYEAAPHR